MGSWDGGEGEGTVVGWYGPFSLLCLFCPSPLHAYCNCYSLSARSPRLLLLSVFPSVFPLRFIQSILFFYPSFSVRPCLFLIVLSGVPVVLPLFAVRVLVSLGNFSWFLVLVPFASCSLHVLRHCEFWRIGLVLRSDVCSWPICACLAAALLVCP